jgi:hypothetical protein
MICGPPAETLVSDGMAPRERTFSWDLGNNATAGGAIVSTH